MLTFIFLIQVYIFDTNEFQICTQNETYSNAFDKKISSEMLNYNFFKEDLCISSHKLCANTMNFEDLNKVHDKSIKFIRILDVFADFEYSLKSIYAKLTPGGSVMLKKNITKILHIGFTLNYSSPYFIILNSRSLYFMNDTEFGLQVKFHENHVNLFPKISYHYLPNCINPATFNVSDKMISYVQQYQEDKNVIGVAVGEIKDIKEIYIENKDILAGYSCFANNTCKTKIYNKKYKANSKYNQLIKIFQPFFRKKIKLSYVINDQHFYQFYLSHESITVTELIKFLHGNEHLKFNSTILKTIEKSIPMHAQLSFISFNIKRTNQLNINYINILWKFNIDDNFIKSMTDVLKYRNCQYLD